MSERVCKKRASLSDFSPFLAIIDRRASAAAAPSTPDGHVVRAGPAADGQTAGRTGPGGRDRVT